MLCGTLCDSQLAWLTTVHGYHRRSQYCYHVPQMELLHSNMHSNMHSTPYYNTLTCSYQSKLRSQFVFTILHTNTMKTSEDITFNCLVHKSLAHFITGVLRPPNRR